MWMSRSRRETEIRHVAVIEGKNEFLELESERLHAEIRRLTELLGNLASRQALTSGLQPPSDPFSEDNKVPNVWMTPDAQLLDAEEIRQKMTE